MSLPCVEDNFVILGERLLESFQFSSGFGCLTIVFFFFLVGLTSLPIRLCRHICCSNHTVLLNWRLPFLQYYSLYGLFFCITSMLLIQNCIKHLLPTEPTQRFNASLVNNLFGIIVAVIF